MIIMEKREKLWEYPGEQTLFWLDIKRLERIIPWGWAFEKSGKSPMDI
jgi:hypothetical protein